MISATLKKSQINFLYYTKSVVPLLHKFTTQNLDLILYPFFVKLNSLSIAVFLLTCQYFGRMKKKFVLSETRTPFYQLFRVRVKKLCYESPRQTSSMFFHSTLEWLQLYIPIISFRLIVLRNRVECQCYNE